MNFAWFFLLFIFILTLLLLNKYANWRKQHTFVIVSTLIGWYFSFLIVLMLPLDVSITFYESCMLQEAKTISSNQNSTVEGSSTLETTSYNNTDESLCEMPTGHTSNDSMLRFWRIVYWSSQFLTWILLPLLQSYSKAGEFNVTGRLKYAFYNNAFYYGIYAAVFIIFMIYAFSKGVPVLSFESLKVLVVSASNTWGLFILTILLGYGLIELPRRLWNKGNLDYRRSKVYFDIDRIYSEKNESEENLNELYCEVKFILDGLKSTRGDARAKACKIMSKFPNEAIDQFLNAPDDTKIRTGSKISRLDVNVYSKDAYLVSLHRKVITAVNNYTKSKAQWNSLLSKAFYIEDLEYAQVNGALPNRWTHEQLGSRNLLNRERRLFAPIQTRISYHWNVKILPYLFRTFGILATLLSFIILWSECFFWLDEPQISITAKIIHLLAKGNHYKYIQICAVIILTYMGLCAYSTVFRLRIYRYYHLDSNQMTDENSLIFSAMLLCRLTAPMCLNFLGTIHLDAHVASSKFETETQFTKLMGHLDLIPFIARGVDVYFPIFIGVVSLGAWFRIHTKLLHSIGVEQFISDVDGITFDSVRNGKSLVQLEKNRLIRFTAREQSNTNHENLLSICSPKRQDDRLTNIVNNEYTLLEEAKLNNDETLLLSDDWAPTSQSQNIYSPSSIFDDL